MRTATLAYRHGLAYVWFVRSGVWTAIALDVRPELYVGFSGTALRDYWGIVAKHLAFALVALLANDTDYVWGCYPPLEDDPFGLDLPAVTVAVSFIAVFAAARAVVRSDPERAKTEV